MFSFAVLDDLNLKNKDLPRINDLVKLVKKSAVSLAKNIYMYL